MPSVRFSIKNDDIDRLQKQMALFGEQSESLINDYLREIGAKRTIESITSTLPESGRKWKGKGRPAKTGNPFKSDFVNLGFSIKSKKKYNYLYFPDQGKGTSRNNQPLEFMDKGLDAVYEKIINEILEILNIEE